MARCRRTCWPCGRWCGSSRAEIELAGGGAIGRRLARSDIEARCAVAHDDREAEFHDVMDQLEVLWGLIAGPQRDLGSQSCEMLARRIGMHLSEWSPRSWTVLVSEDGEAGAVVTTG